MSHCFHCGLPAIDAFAADIEGRRQPFCCLGCQSVTQAIIAGGLGDFYRFRDVSSEKAPTPDASFLAYDLPEVQEAFVNSLESGEHEALISIDGITCAACAWLIENRLMQFDAVSQVSVNATNYRGRIRWDASRLKLSELFSALSEVGYKASPYSESMETARRQTESRAAMMRLGVAGIGMMQVGMFAIALHAGAIQGMESFWQQFFRWVSLIVATPVVLFSARPFFSSALRSLRFARLNMDVPVSLAIGLAYVASAWATFTNTGEVYFDSISMFTFFLLLGRFLEMRVRHGSAFAVEKMSQLLPLAAQRISNDKTETVPIVALKPDDVVMVSAGDVIPCDALVVEGESAVDESILTGESQAQIKGVNSCVFAGTVNGENRLIIKVTAVGKTTQLASVEQLVDNAILEKPAIVVSADRLARYFVGFILVAATLVASYWYVAAPEKALWIVLSVLVATCPCALSLATPAALTAGTLRMRKLGVLVSSAQLLEKLARVSHVVFDKTGTLSKGKVAVTTIKPLGEMPPSQIMQHIAALEAHSRHPIAAAFAEIESELSAKALRSSLGKGIEGNINQQLYRFGQKDFAWPQGGLDYPGPGMWQLFASGDKPLAWVLLSDQPREGITELLGFLSHNNITTHLLSGDRKPNVDEFARAYTFDCVRAEALPADKLAYVKGLQQDGSQVLMIGDGINDVPVLSGASMSIAMGEATKLAQTHADAILINRHILGIRDALLLARSVRAKIRQNLSWALVYNLSILPLAAMGLVPPYVAAIGMSASSLVVVLNALRLNPASEKREAPSLRSDQFNAPLAIKHTKQTSP